MLTSSDESHATVRFPSNHISSYSCDRLLYCIDRIQRENPYLELHFASSLLRAAFYSSLRAVRRIRTIPSATAQPIIVPPRRFSSSPCFYSSPGHCYSSLLSQPCHSRHPLCPIRKYSGSSLGYRRFSVEFSFSHSSPLPTSPALPRPPPIHLHSSSVGQSSLRPLRRLKLPFLAPG